MSKLPEQLYITLRIDEEIIDQFTPNQRVIKHTVGFLHPHANTASAEKKRKTQLDWAYGGWKKEVYDVDGVIWVRAFEWNYGGVAPQNVLKSDSPVPDELQPVIVDNTPMVGFKILRSVSRSTTNNKLWKVLDPRGYEFEISTASFEDIIMQSTIKNGEIMARCAWKANKNLVVVK